MKVLTVIGTRPEIIRLSRVMAVFDDAFDHVIVHTGQNYDYELNEVFFEEMELRRPDHFLEAAGATPAETIGQTIIAADRVIGLEQPDALLVLGDTNSSLAVVAAKRRRVPIFHMEAGNRCFDQRVPEEINRRIVDHTSDINLPYSAIARQYLLAEGLPADRVITTGSPMFEVLTYYRAKIDASTVLTELGLKRGRYFLVSCHREENVDSDLHISRLVNTLGAIAERYDEPILVSTHPRTRARIDALRLEFHPRVQLMKPFGFIAYNALQMNAHAVLSDSGTISEESAILGFPALNIREAHERPEAMEEGTVAMTGLAAERVLQGLAVMDDRSARGGQATRIPADYAVPNVSSKVVTVVLSYTDYVRRAVWKEY
ncbi:MAG TPA: UDP-N-acetylglucosamine 2-epimerase (non-hydrolyzing) [Sphingomicrobium sp.]|nr:UDP-N-acetylglucosamine 2-epimerase (non-hydrolyzing) [Sphingomicrobium sp.]